MRHRLMVDLETPLTVLALALPLLFTSLALWLPQLAYAWQPPTIGPSLSAIAMPGATSQPTPTPMTSLQPGATPAITAGPAARPTAVPAASLAATTGPATTADPSVSPARTTGPGATRAPRSTLPPTATGAGPIDRTTPTDYATSAGLLLLAGLGLVLLQSAARGRAATRGGRAATRASGEGP